MKKITILLLFSLIFSFCSSTDTETTETESQTNDVIIFTKGLGKSTSEYVSNWNKLISEIANDENTVLYFSINPDELRWASSEQTVLFYEFGKLEETPVFFAINLIVENDTVTSVEFFSPVVNDETASQRTKLFFLVLIATAACTLENCSFERRYTSTPKTITSGSNTLTLKGCSFETISPTPGAAAPALSGSVKCQQCTFSYVVCDSFLGHIKPSAWPITPLTMIQTIP